MNNDCSKLRAFEFNKKGIIEYAKQHIEKHEDFEIDYYSKSFKYNGETLEKVKKEISNWEDKKILYRDLYYNNKIKEDTNVLNDLTEEFLIKDINSNDDVLIYLNQVAKILEKYRTKFFGKIRPDYKGVLDKLRNSGYRYDDMLNKEVKKYNKDYEVMVCLADDEDKDLVSSVLINDTMDCFNRGFFDPKVYNGVVEYNKRFINKKEKVYVKTK